MWSSFGPVSRHLTKLCPDLASDPHSTGAVKPTEPPVSMNQDLRSIRWRGRTRRLPVDPNSGSFSISHPTHSFSTSSRHITPPSWLFPTTSESTSTAATSTARPPPLRRFPPTPTAPPHSTLSSRVTSSQRKSTFQPTHFPSASSIITPYFTTNTPSQPASTLSVLSLSSSSSISISASAAGGDFIPPLVGTLVPILVIVLFAVAFAVHRRRHDHLQKELEKRPARPSDEDWKATWLRHASTLASAAPLTPTSSGKDTCLSPSDVLILEPGEKGHRASVSSAGQVAADADVDADAYGSGGMDPSWNGSHLHLLHAGEWVKSAWSASSSPTPSPMPPPPVSDEEEESDTGCNFFPASSASGARVRKLSPAPTFTTFASGRTPPTPLPVYIRALPLPPSIRPLPTPCARRQLPMPRPMPIRPLPELPLPRIGKITLDNVGTIFPMRFSPR
ncbi:hypothetical protein DFH06DRAFT_630600 [Mycena polygramma]|nr:hypothetical protein DFH06DRAFT_630600 [Mycena polygramma]